MNIGATVTNSSQTSTNNTALWSLLDTPRLLVRSYSENVNI